MRKNFYLSGLFLCILALCVCGCGGSGGSAADPMGTGTVRFVDETGTILESTKVSPNGTITLRAKVTNTRTDGTSVPVPNMLVYFVIVNTGNGGSLNCQSNHTGSDGTITAQFTSGISMYSDIVRVTTEVGATDTIYVNKEGGSPYPYIKTLAASFKEVAAGQTSVITANVVDGGGGPVMGVPVTFEIPVNESGAVFSNGTTSYSTWTDVGGNATAVYRAGSNSPGDDVYDTVQATLAEQFSTMAVDIKRTAGTIPSGALLTLEIDPTAVDAEQTANIKATVTGGANEGVNEAVTLTIPVNNSGASFINALGASVSTVTITTGSGGIAYAVYKAGTLVPGSEVQDTIQGVVTSSLAVHSVTITRNSGITGYVLTATANPAKLTLTTGSSIVTAHVADNFGTPVSGKTVSFVVTGVMGTLSVASAATNANGDAMTTYTGLAATLAGATSVVTASATIGGATYTAAVTITYP